MHQWVGAGGNRDFEPEKLVLGISRYCRRGAKTQKVNVSRLRQIIDGALNCGKRQLVTSQGSAP
jgi:hypothetical protein